MKAEIEEIIKKHLPEQVGEVLKQTLSQGERDASTVKEQADALRIASDEISRLNSVISKYAKFDDRNSKLEEREKQCTENERNLKIATLEYQLNCEKEKTEFSKQIALGLVRNAEYRKEVFDTKSGPNGTDQYGNHLYATHTVNATETKTQQ